MSGFKACKANWQLVTFLLPWLLAGPASGDQGDPPARVARLSLTQGSVSFQPSGETQWSQASTNYTVTTGDRLYTEQDSRAELEVGSFAARLSQTTDLTVVQLSDQLMQLGLGQGSIRVSVYDLPADNAVEIDTPNGALSLRRPGSYRVDADPNNGSTLVSVNSGSLEVSGGGVSRAVEGGQAVELTGTDSIQVTPVSRPREDGFDRWCESRDRRIRSFASRQYVSPSIPGAEELDEYGQWQTAPEYGPVWYPTRVAVGWVPYRSGRWAWVEPWGWTWVEDEPWGFCPFHYGRWAFVGSRWGWVPGPVVVAPVYAPALVAFVGGGGFSVGVGVQAWFPLGPREPFFPWYHHGDGYLRQVNVTNVRNVTNITNITNITNVNNINYVNRNVATTAVPAEAFRSGQPVAQRVVRVTPQQMARAQVIPHPSVAPAPTAAFVGRSPVQAPPVRAARVMPPLAGRQPQQPAGRGESPAERGEPSPPGGPGRLPSSPASPVVRNTPSPRTEASQPPRTSAPLPNRPADRRVFSAPPSSAPPRFVTRTPPPPRDVPFATHSPALAQHPGRPLEPQQEQNLRQGKPAGPMRDREFPSHAQAAPERGSSRPPARDEAKRTSRSRP